MADVNVWGENLLDYDNFASTVMENIEKIYKGISLI
jgi:hypothetical protein